MFCLFKSKIDIESRCWYHHERMYNMMDPMAFDQTDAHMEIKIEYLMNIKQ